VTAGAGNPFRVTPKRGLEAGLGPLQVKAIIRIYWFCSAYGSRLSDRRPQPPCVVETSQPHETEDAHIRTLVELGGGIEQAVLGQSTEL